jgi:NAD(P)-dependent dehydrogenase (short-subunit alcohol dehydrogenase family)
MRENGGCVVHVMSIDALHAYPGRSAAAAAMGGILGLIRATAIEWASIGVRVNGVIAGPLEPGTDAPGTPEAREETLLRTPNGRSARPEDVAEAVLFVASDRAAFMTGQTLRVDGGWASLNQAPAGMRFP